MKKKNNNPKLFKSYVLKEINLETNEIMNSYFLNNRNQIVDDNNTLYKIPVFYNDIDQEYSNIISA